VLVAYNWDWLNNIITDGPTTWKLLVPCGSDAIAREDGLACLRTVLSPSSSC